MLQIVIYIGNLGFEGEGDAYCEWGMHEEGTMGTIWVLLMKNDALNIC